MSLRLPCWGLNPIIDYFSHPLYFLKQNIHWILNLSWGHSCNLQATFLFIVLTCVLISPCACILHDWLLIRNLLWNFLHIACCQFHILHEIYMASNKLSGWNEHDWAIPCVLSNDRQTEKLSEPRLRQQAVIEKSLTPVERDILV